MRTRAKADSGFQTEVANARCALCRRKGCAGHHVLSQQFIRSWARTHLRGYDGDPSARLRALLSDRRNRLPLCPDCHANHENAVDRFRVPRRLVPRSAWEFARELDEQAGDQAATVKLERDYPEEP